MKLWVTNPLFPERLTVEAVLVEDQGRLYLQIGGQPVGALEAQALGLSVFAGDTVERARWAAWEQQNQELCGGA